MLDKADNPLIDLATAMPDLAIDLVYAGADNLALRPIYRRAVCLLHRDALDPLGAARRLLREIGCDLLIYDAFRPREAQQALWEACPDERYVAPPERGSDHARGVAVDLTLCGSDGQPLDMGTDFDDMSAASHHGRTGLCQAAQRHRAILLGAMIAAGWAHNPYEWWHYQLPQAARYPLLSAADAPHGPL